MEAYVADVQPDNEYGFLDIPSYRFEAQTPTGAKRMASAHFGSHNAGRWHEEIQPDGSSFWYRKRWDGSLLVLNIDADDYL